MHVTFVHIKQFIAGMCGEEATTTTTLILHLVTAIHFLQKMYKQLFTRCFARRRSSRVKLFCVLSIYFDFCFVQKSMLSLVYHPFPKLDLMASFTV